MQKIAITKEFLSFYKKFMLLSKLCTTGIYIPQCFSKIEDNLNFENIDEKTANFISVWSQINIDEEEYNQLGFEIFLCHTVDNFKNYIGDIVYKVLELRGINTSQLEISKKLESKLTQERNYKDISKYIEETTEIEINPTDATDTDEIFISIAIKIRNLFTHNRGMINQKFIKDMQKLGCDATQMTEGASVLLDHKEVMNYCFKLFSKALVIDKTFLDFYGEDIYCDLETFQKSPFNIDELNKVVQALK